MVPASPPFPTAWIFRFQPWVSIHTSILMSETGLGFSVAVTRQKDGKPRIEAPPLGGAKVSDTVPANVMVVFNNDRNAVLFDKLAQLSTAGGMALSAAAGIDTTARTIVARVRLNVVLLRGI